LARRRGARRGRRRRPAAASPDPPPGPQRGRGILGHAARVPSQRSPIKRSRRTAGVRQARLFPGITHHGNLPLTGLRGTSPQARRNRCSTAACLSRRAVRAASPTRAPGRSGCGRPPRGSHLQVPIGGGVHHLDPAAGADVEDPAPLRCSSGSQGYPRGTENRATSSTPTWR
jgi:hypothetical protein